MSCEVSNSGYTISLILSNKGIVPFLENKASPNLKLAKNAIIKSCSIDTIQDFFDCLAHPNLKAALATDQK